MQLFIRRLPALPTLLPGAARSISARFVALRSRGVSSSAAPRAATAFSAPPPPSASPHTYTSKYSVTVPDVSFTEYVLERATHFGERAALIDAASGRSFTYASLPGRVAGAAAALAAAGVRAGDVVNLHLPNCLEYFIAFAAITSLGAANTTSNPLYMPSEVRSRRGGAPHRRVRGCSTLYPPPPLPRPHSSRTSTATRASSGW